MSDLKDHDPDEGPWLTPFELLVGKIDVIVYQPVDINLYLPDELEDNPNLVRGYN